VTKPLSPALFEILGPKNNWVTTLSFLGHVTSSVTWPLYSPYPVSYSCPIVTKPLSPALFEILGPKVPCAHTHTLTHSQTHAAKWFYILSHARYCIGQTAFMLEADTLSARWSKDCVMWHVRQWLFWKTITVSHVCCYSVNHSNAHLITALTAQSDTSNFPK